MKCVQRILLIFFLLLFFIYGSHAGINTTLSAKKAVLSNSNNTAPLGTQSLSSNLYAVNADSTISLEDGNYELYGTSYCNCVNWLEDSKKVMNFLENFAIERYSQLMSIECKQPIGLADTIFYNMTQMQHKSYYLSFTAANLSHPNLSGFLQDSYTGTSSPINLNGNTVYKFSVTADTASQNPNRFRIVFSTAVLLSGATPVPVTFTSVKARQQNNAVDLQWLVENELNVSQYSIEKSSDGILFTETATVAAFENITSTYNWTDIAPVEGNNFYRIKEIDNDGTVQYSKIISLTVSGNLNAISVYPNPIVSGIIGLQMNNMAAGVYTIRLLNNLGQLLFSKSLSHNKNSNTESIEVPENVSKGMYRLTIIHPDNTISNNNIVF